jgi:hypothetical protein
MTSANATNEIFGETAIAASKAAPKAEEKSVFRFPLDHQFLSARQV